MKKIYALLATALLGSTAFAAPQMEKMTLTPESAASLRAEQAYIAYAFENGIELPGTVSKSWTDPQGTEWQGQFYISGDWSENFSSEGAKLWKKVFAKVQYRTADNNAGRTILLALLYPNYTVAPEFGITKPAGKTNTDAVDLNEFNTTLAAYNFEVLPNTGTANSFYVGMPDDDSFGIMNSLTPNDNGYYCSSNSSFGWVIIRANGTNTYAGAAEGATLKLANFDGETSSLDMHFEGNALNPANQAALWTYDIPFSGEADIIGFSSRPETFEIGEIHVINTGNQDAGTHEVYDEDWGPLTRFYMLGAGTDLTWSEESDWTATSWPENPRWNTNDPNRKANYFEGALYCEPNTADPYGIWYSRELEFEYDPMLGSYISTGYPEAGDMMYGGYNDLIPWSPADGMDINYKDFLWYFPQATTDNAFSMLGTTSGFGMQGVTNLIAPMQLHFTGNIIYHYDASDYRKTREISSIGTIAPPSYWTAVDAIFNDSVNNANVEVGNGIVNVTMATAGVINVYSIDGKIVKSINAAAGTTTIDLGDGLYIVKAGEKAVKVAL